MGLHKLNRINDGTEISYDWGIKKMLAVTASDNPRLLAVFRKQGFSLQPDPESSLVEVSKDL